LQSGGGLDRKVLSHVVLRLIHTYHAVLL
jgi:hypothetical protein